jgi:hypothetical protein
MAGRSSVLSIRRLTLLFGVIAAIGASALPLIVRDARDGSSSHSCLALVSVTYIQKDGSVTADPVPGAVAQFLFSDSSGHSIQAITQPKGWSPMHAGDWELKQYGFPSRPKSGAALAMWEARYRSYESRGPAAMCTNGNTSVPQN